MLSESDAKDAIRWYKDGKNVGIIADLLGIKVSDLKEFLYSVGLISVCP